MASADDPTVVPPDGYPRQWEADVLLADGATVHVRPIRPDDADRLVAFHNRQSPESIYLRFFSARPRLSPREVERFTHIDYVDRMAFVAVLGDEMIGVARYDREPETPRAEVAFITDDHHHGRGLATLLLEYLAAVAREHGITTFTATTLPQNRKMLGVFKQAGFTVSTRFSEGVIEVLLGIEESREALAAIEDRERRAEARSILRLLSPRSVAVIGAGRQRGGLGHEAFRNVLAGGFNGPAYPVNASAPYVLSVRTYPTILDIPDEVDLAVVAVPGPEVLAVVEQCAEKGVKGLVVISAGFAETGPEGAELQRRVVEVARGNGMRLVGPNCMGVVNTAPLVSLRATFAPITPTPGGLAFLSQSGTLGTAIVENMHELGLGLSSFLSLGNKADVSLNDLLQFWEQDERTDAVLLYLESFGNLRKFTRIARRVGRSKPIVSVTSTGARLDTAGELDLPPDATLDALLRQSGVIRVSTLTALFDVTRVLLSQPLPRGPRVAIVSNSSGPARLAVDACRGAGLQPAVLQEETRQAIQAAVPIATHVANPLDLTHAAGPSHYESTLRRVLADPGVDSVIAIFAPPLLARTDQVAMSIAAAADGADKPVLAVVLGADARRGGVAADLPVPLYGFPEEAARALGRVAQYRSWLIEQEGRIPEIEDADPELAHEIVARELATEATTVLDHETAMQLVATYGIRLIPTHLVDDEDAAVAAAHQIGLPVVLKATGLERLSKTETGGLAVDLHRDDEVRQSYERMVDHLGDAMRPAVVQPMVPTGLDVAIRLVQNAAVGSVISIGVGGVVVDQVGFDSLRFLPLTDVDAATLIDSSRIGALLPDGSPERAHLCELLLRISALAEAVPEVADLRLNPVIVSASGAAVTEVRVRIARWTADEHAVRRIEED
ncbi:bifunctional acetate--CoA ligase family protein/GNAT family N-acetyltransferase [Actinomarinicola tropica]|uniref:GNAT family N-acetyltransferase n=1 Tax=Actinomarinicola tropica TaxID=2789776 RepID=A0A5Q2RDX9_9ACTN|nr:GNAT family N-acetyltransferase [Actinomarinicola tropica]QGG95089.1 GNAT family N-acetyltransferase [Actinomarinicola tropica]